VLALLALLVLLALLALMALMALMALLALLRLTLFAETASHHGGNYSGTDTHIRLTALASVDGRIGGL